jgi:hypothetical protein
MGVKKIQSGFRVRPTVGETLFSSSSFFVFFLWFGLIKRKYHEMAVYNFVIYILVRGNKSWDLADNWVHMSQRRVHQERLA